MRQSGYIQFEEDIFARKAQGIGNFLYEVLLLEKFVQAKPQVTSMNMNYYLYCTVKNILNKVDKNEVSDDSFRAFYPI